MNKGWGILCTGIVMVGSTFAVKPQTVVDEVHTISNTAYPSVIRVAIRAYNNPVSPILYVQTIGFQEYCEDTLPNEWSPSWTRKY